MSIPAGGFSAGSFPLKALLVLFVSESNLPSMPIVPRCAQYLASFPLKALFDFSASHLTLRTHM